jgi:asparagine synthase (glutamine-hydrolysing)
MCGIVAVASRNESVDVDEMLNHIAHRGRDMRSITSAKDEDNYPGITIQMGHNRLSINDVSRAGIQPMKYGELTLVVNGEIWNYPQLREEYEERGYEFQSNSDSEIVLYLYKENELKRLDGAFSFVIHDGKKLIVSRDWVGKIPLYISVDDDIIVASETKAFPTTALKSLYVVPRNSLIEVDVVDHEITVDDNYYFQFKETPTKATSHKEVGEKTYELLDNAVRKRLISDVPIATINSGGIDSSIITYLLSKYIKDIKSYTINFDEESEDLKMARIMSEKTGIELVEVKVPNDPDIIKERFLQTIRAIEYPLTVQVEVGIMCSFMAEQIATDGHKVVFSGEGSDEAYGSYGMLRMFRNKPDWSDIRKNLFNKQYYGNLLRGNNIFMNYGTVEIRTPFFDTDFLNYTVNLPAEYTSEGSVWKLPLANAFRGKLPDEIIDQPKRAFQKGTNFKEYIEEVIVLDEEINFNGRNNILSVIQDNYEKIFGIRHTFFRKKLKSTPPVGIYQWI